MMKMSHTVAEAMDLPHRPRLLKCLQNSTTPIDSIHGKLEARADSIMQEAEETGHATWYFTYLK